MTHIESLKAWIYFEAEIARLGISPKKVITYALEVLRPLAQVSGY